MLKRRLGLILMFISGGIIGYLICLYHNYYAQFNLIIQSSMQYILGALSLGTIIQIINIFREREKEKSQKIRYHSTILNDLSLKEWPKKINEIFRKDTFQESTEYSQKENKIIPVELRSLSIIPHYKSLEEHMKLGYPEEWKMWNELKDAVQKYNEERANILEDVRQKLNEEIKNLQLNEFYHKVGTRAPINYIRPDRVAEIILMEIERRLSGFEKWWEGEIKLNFQMNGEIKIWNLDSPYQDVIHNTKEDIVSTVAKFIVFTVESNKIKERVTKLSKMYDEINIKSNRFKEELRKIISSIELGHNIKGKCANCP